MRQRSLAAPEGPAGPRRTAGDGSARAHTAATAFLLLLAAAHGAAAAPALRLSGRLRPAAGAVRDHGAGRAAAEPCIIRAYTAEYLNYEASYLFDRVLGGVLARCGCWLRVLPRARLLADANVTRALIISGTNSDAWPGYAGDLAALAARVDLATLGLVHLGDEHLTDDTAAYPRFAFVLRNYVRGGLPAGAAVAWLPLGYGHLLLPGAAGLRTPASARRLLWSWAGSVGRKPQREAFLGALRAHAAWPALNASGFLETYDWFGADAGGVAAAAAMYTGLLHDSAFVPCPAGRSAEQFRIWEALEAGATPVVLAGEPALSYLGAHGLPVPQLAAWAELPGFLLAQRARPPAELDTEQAALQAAYRRLMRRVRDAASRAVCGLADG